MQSALSQTNLAPPQIRPTSRLQPIVDRVITSVLQPFAAQNLQPDQIAVTVVDLRDMTLPMSSCLGANASCW